MGSDKGRLVVGGQTQVERCVKLLEPFCESVVVSVHRDQACLVPYDGFQLVVDNEDIEGPAAGLLAAWSRFPDTALLVLAVDMLLVNAGTLQMLVGRRDAASLATAFRPADGVFEPLCTIWEPAAWSVLVAKSSGRRRSPSLRRLLGEAKVNRLVPHDPAQLASANTPDSFSQVVKNLG